MNLRKFAKITVTSALAMCMVATPMVSKASDDNVRFRGGKSYVFCREVVEK